ncbi:B-cell receptor CD22-like [Ptychodera flava]|uniref:B-cell receptor CD22-like n=1 Tax=Ptychodera flava TaxID=63121 RepID=UPI00396A3AF5
MTLVIYGDSTQLNCSYVGERMVAAWYKGEPPNHVRLTLGRTSQNPELYEVVGDEDMFEYNLRIRNATKESSDLYECTDLDLPGNSETAYVFVIDGVPICSVHPGETVIQGDSVAFECLIDLNENAPGDLVWLQNGEEVSRHQGKHYTWETQLSSSDHNATFDCQLQHYTLPNWKWSTISCLENIRMNVQYAPDVSVVYASQNPMREEADFIAVCEAIDANPEEKTDEYWIGPDGKMISVSTSLLLLNVSRETSGEYTCFMSNVFYNGVKGNGTATVEIDVQYLSSIDMAVTPFVNITEGDEVTIHCEALDGNPDPHRLEMLFEGMSSINVMVEY